MKYVGIGCLLVPLMSNCMEVDSKDIPEFLKVVDTSPTTEPNQVLNLYRSQSRFCLVPESEYIQLKRLTQVERDVGLLYEALAKLNKERQESVCAYLLSMKQGDQTEKWQIYLKKNPWILDESHNIIFSFIKSAQLNPGEFTNNSIDSIVSSATSSRSTTRSLQPSYMLPITPAPVTISAQGMSGPSDTETLRQMQLLQIQQNQITQQLSLHAIAAALEKQKSTNSKRSNSGIESGIESAIHSMKVKKLIKAGITAGSFLMVLITDSIVSYFIGNQQKSAS